MCCACRAAQTPEGLRLFDARALRRKQFTDSLAFYLLFFHWFVLKFLR